MNYTNALEIENLLGEVYGKLDTSSINETITAVSAYIDDRLKSVVKLPFSSVPPIINRIAKAYTVYDLYIFQTADDIPQAVTNLHQWAERFLDRIAEGRISLAEYTDDETDSGNSVNWSSKEKVF